MLAFLVVLVKDAMLRNKKDHPERCRDLFFSIKNIYIYIIYLYSNSFEATNDKHIGCEIC